MAVISVTVTQSSEQVVAGIPKTVSITTNITSTIFYTLDGTDPTLFSTIYTGPIFLPFDQLLVTLKILATNGVDSSPIVVEQYMTNIVDGNARLGHAGTTAQAGSVVPNAYPFGTPPFQPQQGYVNPAEAGPYGGAVYNPELPATPTGFDGQGNPTGYTNQPYNITNYQITYTNRDALGNQGSNIGNLPGKTILPYPSDVQPDKGQTSGQGPEETNQFTSLFDPRAMVIFQDFSTEDPSDPPQINRQFFSLENAERARDGTFYFNTGLDASAPVSGSFVRAHYNPRTNTMTHYYRDSWSNKWIISTAPYQPTGTFDGNMAQMAMGTKSGAGVIFEWLPFARRVLF
jgi:hypothetical protein